MNLEENLKTADGQPAPARPRFIVRDAAYILQPRKPLEWVIEKLITKGSVSVFYGEPGSKKTYSLLSLAVCAALGKSWLGFTVQPCKVLIIDEESGEERLTLRLAAALRGEMGDEDAPIKFISLASFKLDSKDDPAIVQALIEEIGAGLVIIDALADVMDGDENSKQDTQPVLNNLRRIAEGTQAAIILIHHSNRQGGYRGTSAIKGSVDLMVKLESEDDSKWINFKSEKNRDGEPIKWTAVANWTDDQFYLEMAEHQERQKTRPDSDIYVLDYLKTNGPSDIKTLEDNAEICSDKAARAAVYRLAKEGLIHRTNKGANGTKAKYELIKKD